MTLLNSAWKVPASEKSEHGKYTFLNDLVHHAKKTGFATNVNYTKHSDWKADSIKVSNHGHSRKSEFSKTPRLTFSEIMMKQEKKRAVPPPGSYQLPPYAIKKIPKYTGA